MHHKSESPENRALAWVYLRDGLKADIALLQEAAPPGHYQQVYKEIDRKKYNWGSAVVSFQSGLTLRGRTRVPLADCYLTALTGDALPDSHPGACAVADVCADGRVCFTAVSLYGQWEALPNGQSYSCARVHRMLSDLTGVFASKGTPVILAGDLNTTTQGAASAVNLATPVFGRLEAWGLVDCVWYTRDSRPRLVNCTCPTPQDCSHVRTYKHNRREDSDPTQWDYAFISKSLVHDLRCRVADEPDAWALSDHCPIVLDVSV
jgi:hypothetical protein